MFYLNMSPLNVLLISFSHSGEQLQLLIAQQYPKANCVVIKQKPDKRTLSALTSNIAKSEAVLLVIPEGKVMELSHALTIATLIHKAEAKLFIISPNTVSKTQSTIVARLKESADYYISIAESETLLSELGKITEQLLGMQSLLIHAVQTLLDMLINSIMFEKSPALALAYMPTGKSFVMAIGCCKPCDEQSRQATKIALAMLAQQLPLEKVHILINQIKGDSMHCHLDDFDDMLNEIGQTINSGDEEYYSDFNNNAANNDVLTVTIFASQ